MSKCYNTMSLVALRKEFKAIPLEDRAKCKVKTMRKADYVAFLTKYQNKRTQNEMIESLEPVVENLEPVRASYTSLSGYTVAIDPSERQIMFPTRMWETLLRDPVTYEWMRAPVYLNNNVYDKDSLGKWFRGSNIDPLNGYELTEINLIPVNVIAYLLLAFEEQEDTLIYHSVQSNPLFAATLIQSIPFETKEYRNEDFHNIDAISLNPYAYIYSGRLSNDSKPLKSYHYEDFRNVKEEPPLGRLFTDCLVPEAWHNKPGIMVETSFRYLSPFDLLLICPIFGDLISNALLTSKGLIVNKHFLFDQQYAYNYYGFQGLLFKNTTQIPCNVLHNKMIEIWKEGIVMYPELMTKSFRFTGAYDLPEKNKTIPGTISIHSPYERIYERVLEIEAMIDRDPTLKTGFAKLSQMLASTRDVENLITNGQHLIDDKRSLYSLPFIESPDYHGQDLSFTTLQDLTFDNKHLKCYCFAKANIRNCTFNNCHFYHTVFVGAHLDNTRFIDCLFGGDCSFHHVTKSRVQFIRAEIHLSPKYLEEFHRVSH